MTISMKEQEQMPGEMVFPEAKLKALEEKISHSRWVVPVLPEQELEALLNAATELATKGEDINHVACQRFYNDALTISFTKILTDDAVSSWKNNIQQCVRSNCEKLVKLCTMKLDDPRFLHLLSMAFNPNNKFHTFNASRTCEGLSVTTNSTSIGQGSTQELEVFAKSQDHRTPRGWLVHLINVFGQAGGFIKLRERFEIIMGFHKPDLTSSINSEEKITTEVTEKEIDETKVNKLDNNEQPSMISESSDLSTSSSHNEQPSSLEQSLTGETRVAAVWQLLRPLGLCHDLLTPHTVTTYLLPVLECIPTLLESLTDEELKREARGSENKTDTVSCLIRACKYVSAKTPHPHSLLKSLEMFRLKMILRLLQMSSFNGKMSALNEINQLISTISQQPKPEWLTPAVMTNWIRENKVVDIVLRDSLHQPQYVDRLEKMLRFMIKENSLTRDDLDAIWKAQHGKHEAIVKNLHDLLAKLAWDFTPDQLDHLFDCFKASWATSSKKQSDKLLEVIRRLAEDDKDGVMANKVLILFWNLAHSDEVCTEIMDVALANLIKILDYSCSQDRDAQKTLWLDKCVEELKTNEKWVLPALKVMREICCLYEAGGGTGVRPHVTRQELIDRLQTQHSLVILVTDSLTHYMDGVRNKLAEEKEIDWENWLPDGRYPHSAQVHERLSFLRFLLKDGQLWLCAEQAKQIWVCLAERPAHLGDREACFRWFSKLMGDEPDLDPNINLHFFRRNIMTLPPNLLTHAGIKCFERFFKAVNSKEGKLKTKRRSFLINDADLIGLDYLWRVITDCSDEISARGIELLREVCTCVGPALSAALHHEDFLTHCCARTQRMQKDMELHADPTESCTRMCRVIRAIQEYVNECDRRFSADRQILPMYRSGRGRQCTIIVRFNFQTGQRQIEDIELISHSNETLHSLRSAIQRRLKCAPDSNIKLYVNKLELYVNGELLDSSHDRKILAQIPLRDKTVIVAKVYDGPVCGSGGCGSSNESSSDSSTSSPPLPPTPEHALPGVLFAQGSWYLPFILELEHVGITKGHIQLTEAAHLLSQICPAHKQTVEKLTEALLCRDDSKLRALLYDPTPPTVAYNIQVLYSMIMSSNDTRLDRSRSYQVACVKKAPLLVQCLSDKEFLQGAAPHTRRVGYLALVRLAKLALYTLGHLFEILAPDGSDSTIDKEFRMDVTILREALQTVPNHSCELIVKALAEKLANTLGEQVVTSGEDSESVSTLVWWRIPTAATVRALYALAYRVAQPPVPIASSTPCAPPDAMLHPDDVTLVRECMEVVTICMALGGLHLKTLLQESWWQDTALYLMIDCPNPQVRVSCAEQLLAACAWGGGGGARDALAALAALAASARLQRHAAHAMQFLQLLCRLVALAGPTERTLHDLVFEVAWLRAVRKNPETLDDTLLEGHLNLTKELFNHVPAQIKYQYGAHPDHKDSGLIKEVTTEFLWPYSWAWCRGGMSAEGGEGEEGEPAAPLCRTPGAAAAATDLLLSLVHGCVPNMAALANLLEQMFYSEKSMPLSEWEYMPCVGPRPMAGLVGLKNAGATCYMNSVLQQLYCVRAVRDALLAVEGAATDLNEDFSGESQHHNIVENNIENNSDYNITILKQVQAIFAHLHYSKLQYYVPRGLWAHFRLQGEPVNLREQQDAVEFFMSLVESLDEALKSLGQEQLMAKTMGGTYSDQKICKGCPHRYCKEEPFSVVSLDIRNMSRLQESLEAYVRGELLEGADAYHCDKCNKKVVTVKRLCLNKLPPVLVIQLKRFEYDFEKVCAIKFNDYFEFPRELDVEPYTAWGLARAEGDATLWDGTGAAPETHYRLSGIVVHSGQASGGHYYSYVLLRDNGSETGRWVKLDDGDVTECAMHDDEEMKAQCFGGEYMGEVFDQMLKRVYKRQKRWWNAYMLFYTRIDTIETENLEQTMKNMTLKDSAIPRPIWLSVHRSNIAFSHNQDQFSLEHFNFMKKLCYMRFQMVPGSQSAVWSPEQEEMSMLAVQLATKFLFQVGFRTKKALRGPAADWHDILCQHLRCSQSVRAWFATDLFRHSHRLCDYLLSCPSAEVRIVFMKIIVFLADFSIQDPPVSSGYGAWCSREEATSLSDQVLCCARALATPPTPVASHGTHSASDAIHHRHLPLLFNLFHTYAMLGLSEKHQLLRLKILEIVLTVCMDDSSSSLGKYQYPESAKIHQVVSVLARCCDVSARCHSANAPDGALPLPNPYADPPAPAAANNLARPTLSPVAADVLYNKTGAYMKKLTEDCCGCEEGIRLLQFLCWEHAGWSRIALAELLWQMAYAYCHELRRHADALAALLLMEDSWQHHRIHNVIKGVSEERPGLLETASRARVHYQKRAYACVKLVVGVMTRVPAAVRAVHAQPDARRRWRQLLVWLQEELDRKYGPGSYGTYGTWSPPGTSNETSSGYFLERSNSARKTLEKAYQLCPEEEDEEEDTRETTEGSASGEAGDDSGDDDDAVDEDEPPARRLQLAPPTPAAAPASAATTVPTPSVAHTATTNPGGVPASSPVHPTQTAPRDP